MNILLFCYLRNSYKYVVKTAAGYMGKWNFENSGTEAKQQCWASWYLISWRVAAVAIGDVINFIWINTLIQAGK